MTLRILIIEDEVVLASNFQRYLKRHGYETHVANTGAEGLRAVEEFEPDLVLIDYMLGDMSGLAAVARIREDHQHIKLIMMTGHGNVEVAVNAMKAGADDYLGKPLSMQELKLTIDRTLDRRNLEKALTYYRDRDSKDGLPDLIGESAPMRHLKQKLRQIIAADGAVTDGEQPAVLVTGETGTGKELIARALHVCGPRKDKPFVEINCTSIPAHLIEAELFGYERGAFTDAKESKLGLVEAAEGGTLFLDEIGDVEPALQAKLLKLLEDRIVRRLGSVRDRRVDIRIVAATNRPLEQMVADKEFRADLYFRLKVISIAAPALRDRDDDILFLARHFLTVHKRRYRKPNLEFTRQAEQALREYDWPGNVRELRNVIEQAVLLAASDSIGREQLSLLSPHAVQTGVSQPLALADDEPLSARGVKLEEIEQQLIKDALEKCGWNVSRAAKMLGLSRDTLRYRIPKFGLVPPNC
jgi:two-component system, NtrC family, response regulator AtoC